MAETSLHIHIDNPVSIEQVDKILTAAMEAKDIPEMQPKVPSGYRCAQCFRSDGGHEANCTIGMQGMKS